MQYKEGDRREEFGQTWEWRDPDLMLRGHWKCVEVKTESPVVATVLIFPPSHDFNSWYLFVDEDYYHLRGNNAEERAFCAGAAYARQHRGRLPASKE